MDYSLGSKVIQFLRMKIAIIIFTSDAANIHIDIPRYSRVTTIAQALLLVAEKFLCVTLNRNNKIISMFASTECNGYPMDDANKVYESASES